MEVTLPLDATLAEGSPGLKVSVILVSYNQALALRRAVAALEKSEKREQMEILVIDGGTPLCEDGAMAELVFEVTQEADGGYCAECLTLDIFTQADGWDELRKNVREAVRAYFFDGDLPGQVRLHFIRDEVLAPL